MSRRKPGSGLANATTAAIEELLAAALRGDAAGVSVEHQRLRDEFDADRCGIEPGVVAELIAGVVEELALGALDAVAQPVDGLGDVRVSLSDGRFVWFEVKAQTKKNRFADLTQADWVRDETDFLRWLLHHDPRFAAHLPVAIAETLTVEDPDDYFSGWDPRSLWLADLALVSSRRARTAAGIDSRDALRDFLDCKFVLHLTREGVRVVRLSCLAPVEAVLAGELVDQTMKSSNQTAVAVALASPGPAAHGTAQFTYHVGYPSGVVGRHKLHAVSMERASAMIEVRA